MEEADRSSFAVCIQGAAGASGRDRGQAMTTEPRSALTMFGAHDHGQACGPSRCYPAAVLLACRRQTYWITPNAPTAKACPVTNATPSRVGVTRPLTTKSALATVQAALMPMIAFTAFTGAASRAATKATKITYGISTSPASRINATGRPSQASRESAPATSNAAVAPLAAASARRATRRRRDIGTALVTTTSFG